MSCSCSMWRGEPPRIPGNLIFNPRPTAYSSRSVRRLDACPQTLTARDGARGRFMSKLSVRRIDYANPEGARQLLALRTQLSAQGDVVSQRGRELTERVFGEALPPARVVERVCAEVRERGLAAVLHYTEQFDK